MAFVAIAVIDRLGRHRGSDPVRVDCQVVDGFELIQWIFEVIEGVKCGVAGFDFGLD